MGWNHRVFKKVYPDGYIQYSIREVYGDVDSGGFGYSSNPIAPVGDDLEDLRWVLEKMLESLDNPVLEDKAS